MTTEQQNYNLFLDDIRMPNKVSWINLPLVDWVIVRNFDQFTAYIKLHGLPLRVSFDHDLADEHYAGDSVQSVNPTGYDCVKWMVQYCIDHEKPFPEYYLHTLNDNGLMNMLSYIRSFEKTQNANATRKTNTSGIDNGSDKLGVVG